MYFLNYQKFPKKSILFSISLRTIDDSNLLNSSKYDDL